MPKHKSSQAEADRSDRVHPWSGADGVQQCERQPEPRVRQHGQRRVAGEQRAQRQEPGVQHAPRRPQRHLRLR